MKKFLFLLTLLSFMGGMFYFSRVEGSDSLSEIARMNVEALCQDVKEDTIGDENGTPKYHCNDEICLVFEYKNRFWGGCKAATGFVCKCQKTNVPNIDVL